MNVWQFRKAVRANRARLKVCCPAGVVIFEHPDPSKNTAARVLGISEPYVRGMMNGFDQLVERTTCYVDITADSPAADQYAYRDGYLYGKRIAKVALVIRSGK